MGTAWCADDLCLVVPLRFHKCTNWQMNKDGVWVELSRGGTLNISLHVGGMRVLVSGLVSAMHWNWDWYGYCYWYWYFVWRHIDGSLKELEMCKHQRTDSDAMSVDKPDLLAEMQSALRQLVPQSHHGWRLFKGKPCNSDLGESNVNTQLWRQYSSKWDLVWDSLRHHRTCPRANCLAPPVDQLAALFRWIWLDVQANEVLLLHGTSKETADKIAKQGFDERLCQRGLYGHGVYLKMLWNSKKIVWKCKKC